MPKGVLLVGPPGTGKTLLAKAVAGEADVPFIYASGSEFDEMFVGIGSMRIRQMFQSAKDQAPAIIFIDEIDAVGSKRNARDPQHSRMSLNQLLIELDGFSESTGVVVIAATNFPETLDKALLRPGRFDKHVHVPLPDVVGRKKILNLFTKDIRLGKDVDLGLMSRATPGFSGADLNKLVNQAKIMASLENSMNLQMKHLERSRDEMLMGAERKSFLMSLEDRQLTAFHEGGHALVALYTEHATPLHKATIIPRGSALGLVSQVPDRDEYSATKKALLARMDVAMGGRVAEELLFGADMVTTGASSDFSQATRIARSMVMEFGMSDRIGPMVFSDEDSDSIGSELRSVLDSEIKQLLEDSRLRATRILQDHRVELNRLAEALLEHETLSKDEIIAVCRGEKLKSRVIFSEPEEDFKREEPVEDPVVKGRIMKTGGFTIFFNKEN
jgi:ATP-dependent metalloprotease